MSTESASTYVCRRVFFSSSPWSKVDLEHLVEEVGIVFYAFILFLSTKHYYLISFSNVYSLRKILNTMYSTW